jgi:polysaccharide deacetylase family protein (PEP-CTERM system associated)
VLELLGDAGATGTFFVVGWVAERCPDLVRRIAAAGHEVASHGWWHRRVGDCTPDEFRAEVRDSRALLEDLSGRPVRGFRAPSFSIGPGREWAFDVLVEEGYEYDSSLFPIRRPGYGDPGAPRVPHVVRRQAGEILEIPMATAEVGGVRIPVAGGAYLRHLPLGVTRRGLHALADAGVPGMFYVHPWELDPGQPRLRVSPLTRWRHYGGLSSVRERLELLLREFRFTSVEAWRGIDGGTSSTPPGAPREALARRASA